MEDSSLKVQVARLFFDISKSLNRGMRKCFEETGITLPQHMVIHSLMKSGEMKLTDLSREINLSNSTTSGIVDRLEKQQLVERTRSEEDRRVIYVRVTPKFYKLHEEFKDRSEKNFEEILGDVTPEELKKIIDGLKTLKKVIT